MEETETEIRLSPGQLRRLARLHARAEGARAVYQVAMQAANEAQVALQEALNVACEDAGMRIPSEQAPIDIDWVTGRVQLRQERANGRVSEAV